MKMKSLKKSKKIYKM